MENNKISIEEYVKKNRVKFDEKVDAKQTASIWLRIKEKLRGTHFKSNEEE